MFKKKIITRVRLFISNKYLFCLVMAMFYACVGCVKMKTD